LKEDFIFFEKDLDENILDFTFAELKIQVETLPI
jgi:hypothetical protein